MFQKIQKKDVKLNGIILLNIIGIIHSLIHMLIFQVLKDINGFHHLVKIWEISIKLQILKDKLKQLIKL